MAGLHDPLPPAHYVTHTYVAMCSCGWRSRDEKTERDAEYELRIHQEDAEYKLRIHQENTKETKAS